MIGSFGLAKIWIFLYNYVMKMRSAILFFFGLLIVIIPIFLNTATDTEFTFNKTSLFQFEILLILSAIFFTKGYSVRDVWKYYKGITVLLSLYLFVLVLSMLFSQSPYVSFFGPGRLQGLMQYLFYFSLIFIAFTQINKLSYIQKLIYWIVVGSVIVSIIGLLERAGLIIFSYTVFDSGIASTLGHPSFLGGYLVMVIPLTVALLFSAKSNYKKWPMVFAALFQILALYFTYTRGAWVALVTTFVFVLIILLIKLKKKKLLYSLLVFMIIGGSVLIGTGVLQRITGNYTGSGALRILWAGQAIEAIKASPWLGYGMETQRDVLAHYYDPLQGVYGYYNDFADRVHNEFLDSAVTSGLIGLAVYLLILIYTFVRAIKLFLNNKYTNGSVTVFALTVGLFAYIVQGIFSFSVTVLSIYLWFYIALVFIILRLEKEKSDVVENLHMNKNSVINRLLGLCFVILVGIITIRPIIADNNLRNLTKIDLNKRFAFYELQDGHTSILPYVKNSSGEIAYRFRYVDLLIQLGLLQEDSEKKETLFSLAEDELNIIKEKNPENIDYDFTMGYLMRQWGKVNPNKYDLMGQSYYQAILKSPKYAPIYFYWGMGLEDGGLLMEAKDKYQKALGLFADPNSYGITDQVKEHLSIAIASVYERLSSVEMALGNTELADKYENRKQVLMAPYVR